MSKASRSRTFDFEMTEADELRAMSLHRDAVVVDMLSQHAGGRIFDHYSPALQAEFRRDVDAAGGGYPAFETSRLWPYEIAYQGRSNLLRDWYIEAGLTCGAFDIPVHNGSDSILVNREEKVLSYKSIPWIRFATTTREIREAKKAGQIAMYGNCQPITPAPRDLAAFDVAYENGVRSFMLTYNRMDHIGVGCTERVDAGLSMFGLDVVAHCNRNGIVVDVSHCGRMTTLDACKYSKAPVTANHSGAKTLFDHARLKSDDEIKAIAATGGVVGVLAIPFFLTSAPSPTIEVMLDHIDYIRDLVGWQHVAIGTDWPLQAPNDVLIATLGRDLGKSHGFRAGDQVGLCETLIGFEDCRDLPNVTRGLVKRGYSDEQIRGVLGENALRVFETVWGE